jgi:chromosome segregation ATPase
MALDASNRGRQEVEKTIKRYVTQIQDLQRKIDDEQHGRDDSRESYVMTERRCNVLISEVDEIRTALEQSERARKMAENELYEATDRVNELQSQISSVQAQKRKAEGDLKAMAVSTNSST